MEDELLNMLATNQAVYVALAILLVWFVVAVLVARVKFARLSEELALIDTVTPNATGQIPRAKAGHRIMESLYRWYEVCRAFTTNPLAPSPFIQDWLSDELLDSYEVTRPEYAHRHATFLYLGGMVFTFAGLLAVFLATYRAAETGELVASLKLLLAASALKFAASLAGVVLGMLFIAYVNAKRAAAARHLASLRQKHVGSAQISPPTFMTSTDANRLHDVIKVAVDKIGSAEGEIRAIAKKIVESKRSGDTTPDTLMRG